MMKTRIISLCVCAIMSMAQSFGGITLTIPDVNITPGTTSYVVINFDLGAQAYTAYQFDIAYPEGISSVDDNEDNPAFTKGDVYNNSHSVSSGYAPDGKARFQCFSPNSAAFTAQSGTLLILPVKAAKSLAEGTYQATISPIEFSQTDATPDRPDAVTFNIKVSNIVVLDETSTMAPPAATNVDVRVNRTINADQWSTICLPFAMTENQVKAAFGDDVKLGDFTGYTPTYDGDNVTAITVNFSDATAIEANHPYIIKVENNMTEFTVDGVEITPSDNPSVTLGQSVKEGKNWVYHPKDFIGTYVADFDFYNAATSYPLFLSDNMFYYATKNTKKMKAFRAFFDFDDYLPEAEKGEASARVKMSISDDGNTTNIDPRTMETIETGKVYNMAGQYVGEAEDADRLPKGIYIVTGKKKVIK